MKIILCLISIISIDKFSINAQKLKPEPKVVKIVEFFRHGARYPISNILGEKSIEKNGSMLTANGMSQHQDLGKKVKESYPHLFSKEYDHNQIYVVSSHTQRTVESALSHLMGFFDLKSGLRITNNNKKFTKSPFNNISEKKFERKLEKKSKKSKKQKNRYF